MFQLFGGIFVGFPEKKTHNMCSCSKHMKIHESCHFEDVAGKAPSDISIERSLEIRVFGAKLAPQDWSRLSARKVRLAQAVFSPEGRWPNPIVDVWLPSGKPT